MTSFESHLLLSVTTTISYAQPACPGAAVLMAVAGDSERAWIIQSLAKHSLIDNKPSHKVCLDSSIMLAAAIIAGKLRDVHFKNFGRDARSKATMQTWAGYDVRQDTNLPWGVELPAAHSITELKSCDRQCIASCMNNARSGR